MTKKNVNEIYQKMDPVEHVLKLPDTYVGSIERHTEMINVVVEENGVDINGNEIKIPKIKKKQITFVPALYKIYDEIIANAEDQDTRLKMDLKNYNLKNKKKKNKKPLNVELVTTIKINVDKEQGMISILNDGDGIDIVMMKEHNMYPPELIFGNLLTSANYDEKQEKITGGKNGYGAKLANIFSTKFIVETVDRIRKKHYIQTFTNNMSEKTEPKITKYTKKPYTKITFYPDFKRFNMDKLEDDIYSLFVKRAYDVAAWTDENVQVYLNDKLINIKSFKEYADLYLNSSKKRVYEKLNDYWEVIATHNNDEIFEQVSFVNGINTIRGGKHVDYIVDQIKEKMVEYIKKKNKINVKPVYVKNQLMVFVKSTIVNPSFDGQTKETLTTSKKKFGSTCEISQKFIIELAETGIIEKIIMQAEYKNSKVLKKTDGKKTLMVRGIPKLTDANKAGGKFSKKCTLILTEGDSAKSMAISGLSEVGRDYYGVFPLRGKVVNVKDADIDKILKNQEISNLKKIIGLKTGEDYSNKTEANWPLRYGKIMIMTDQDTDGSHIKGLIMNLFHTFWPSLLKNDFVTSLITPIIKATKGKKVETFYTLTQYEDWKKANKNGKGWYIKYYKGLGTSTSKEAKEYFKNEKTVGYKWNDKSNEFIDLAFNKKRADDRKVWLQHFNKNIILDCNDKHVTYDEFIEKEFKHFSNYDLERSIPSIVDGMKPSQRKVMFACFKRNLTKEIKVAQLAGYTSEHSAYHHGEGSLQGTIVKLAQNFVGSNNINLLKPNGQFGTRMLGGKDSASCRYIFTELNEITNLIFNSKDHQLLKYKDDDGQQIEPEWYVPIIPMVLINGCQGIGTGYSSNITNYNPIDIINIIKNKIKKKSYDEPKPWFRKFKGDIKKLPNSCNYMTFGKYVKLDSARIKITELPIGTWTEDYKQFLDTLLIDKSKPSSKQILISFDDYSTESNVEFILRFKPITLMRIIKKGVDKRGVGELEKLLKLTSTKGSNLSNMHLYDTNGKIKKYNNCLEIIDEFYNLRLKYYVLRKKYLLAKLSKELELISFRVKFINEILNDTIDLRKKKKSLVYEILKNKGYPLLCTNVKNGNTKSYDYLIKMGLDTLTEERLEELNKIHKLKETEYNKIKSTTEEEMWLEDLSELSSLYKKNIKKENKELKEMENNKSKSKNKLKNKNKTKIKNKIKK